MEGFFFLTFIHDLYFFLYFITYKGRCNLSKQLEVVLQVYTLKQNVKLHPALQVKHRLQEQNDIPHPPEQSPRNIEFRRKKK